MLVSIGLMAISIYLLIQEKKQQNDNDPVLIFDEKSFMLDEDKISWEKINFWEYKEGSNKDSKGYVLISYQDTKNDLQEVKADFDQLNIDRIDFLLLMAHFKIKYGSVDAREVLSI